MYAYDTSAANAAVNTITISPAAGSVVLIFSATSAGGGTPTVTFSDNSSSTWVTSLNNSVVNSTHYSVGYCLSAVAGVTTITATYNGGTPGECNLMAVSYTGLTAPTYVATATANNQSAPGTGSNAVVSSALACGSTNALFVGCTMDVTGNNSGISAGTGFTSRISASIGGTAGFGCIEDPNAEVTGSNTATWTVTHGGDIYASFGIAIADNASGGGGNPLFYNRKNVLYFIN